MARREEAGGKRKFGLRLLRIESQSQAKEALRRLGADWTGVNIMSPKMQHAVVYVEDVQARAAHILKQVMLSKGGECATPRGVFSKDAEPVNVILMGTVKQLEAAARNLSLQPFGLAGLAAELLEFIRGELTGERAATEVVLGRHRLSLGGRTLIMGTLNVTPDSFYDGGLYFEKDSALKRAFEIVGSGADILDVGGESTRPGAEPVPLEEELERTIPLIELLSAEVDIPISIDTYKSEVARSALEAGASIVNDISGLRFDPGMIPLVAERGAMVVIMHMKGTPRDMQVGPTYDDVVGEICDFLRQRSAAAIQGGVDPQKIVIDPGIGFGKTVAHNLEIMRRLDEFKSLGFHLLVGTSRKSFIGAVLGEPVEGRLFGTAATVSFAVSRGADIVRVHDVGEMAQVVRMTEAMRDGKA